MATDRIKVLKTYKMYVGGKFPRTESGRYYLLEKEGDEVANICLASRKDFRNAVVAARKAQTGWVEKTAYNRSQILYRMAEILEDRRAQFIEELITLGSSKKEAEKEVDTAVDRLIYYAGWCDKFVQFRSSVNPVASSYFNFSIPEATGVVSIIAPENSALLGLVSVIAPVISSGNACVLLASESKPLCAITFAEVLNASDVPGGVVNILTGTKEELVKHMASHMDVNAILYGGNESSIKELIQKESVENLKRVRIWDTNDLHSNDFESPYTISDFVEIKTTWHPIEKIGPSGSAY